jgi:ATP:corrinoid adenosyltransferase
MFYIMQLSKCIPMLGMYIPAQIEMYFDEFRKMLDFETMNPDSIIGIFAPNMTMLDLIMGGPKNQSEILEID